MENGYKRVSGNSNIVFEHPLRALVICNEENDPGYSPDISMDLDDNPVLMNWMFVKKKK